MPKLAVILGSATEKQRLTKHPIKLGHYLILAQTIP